MNLRKKFTLQCLLASSLCMQQFELQADSNALANLLIEQNNKIFEKLNETLSKQLESIEDQRQVALIMSGLLGACSLYFIYTDYMNSLPYIKKEEENINEEKKEETKITFADVAGLDEAKESAQDIIEYLKNPNKFTDMGAKIPKGILMHGGPGNGKTLFARAIAGEADCHFKSVSGSEFMKMYVGAGASRVRELFAEAQRNAPCIIFIDEIDAIGSKRNNEESSANKEHNQTINQLLAEMDGFKVNEKPIIVIAATNRADALDEALLRPGRFDRKIHINKPYIKDRAHLLRIDFAKTHISDDVNIDHIARGTIGFSGAELTNLVNEAIILAIKDNSTTVCMKHIETAYDNITLGCENKGMHQTKENLWNTAIHEAGHLIGFLFKDKTIAVRKVSITPRGNTLGVAHMLPLTESYSFTKNDMKNRIISLLAGRFAEEAFGFDLSSGAENDLQRAHEIAYDMVVKYGMANNLRDASYSQLIHQLPNDVGTKIHEEIDTIIEECRQTTRQLIADHIDDIQQIAELLMEKGTVLGSEIYQLLNLVEPQGINFNL